MDEGQPEEFLEDQHGREAATDAREENDPFSLRGIDSRRTAELVSCHVDLLDLAARPNILIDL